MSNLNKIIQIAKETINIEQKAIVGMYNLEIAEQKIEETVRLSRANGYQLSVSLDQAD